MIGMQGDIDGTRVIIIRDESGSVSWLKTWDVDRKLDIWQGRGIGRVVCKACFWRRTGRGRG